MNKQLPLPAIPAKLRPRPSKAKGYVRNTEEERQQAALFEFLRLYTWIEPRFKYIHASLNGLYLTGKVLATATAIGRVPGPWDVLVPFVGCWDGEQKAGMFIEMKHKTNLTESQEGFRDAVGDAFAWVVCHTEKEASCAICAFLGVTDPDVLEAIK